ncbi:MAG: hypothetical protein LUC45_06145, partial [Paraprevotella sp.]|nr:hypothetical protein [Paraprevotella sp.]
MRNNLTGRENVHHWWVSGLLYVLILSQFFLVPLAWLGSAAGLPLRNLLSSEGIRWYYLHIQDCFHSRILM